MSHRNAPLRKTCVAFWIDSTELSKYFQMYPDSREPIFDRLTEVTSKYPRLIPNYIQ